MNYKKAELIKKLTESIAESRRLSLRLFDEATEEDEEQLADAASYISMSLKYGNKQLYIAACGLSGDSC